LDQRPSNSDPSSHPQAFRLGLAGISALMVLGLLVGLSVGSTHTLIAARALVVDRVLARHVPGQQRQDEPDSHAARRSPLAQISRRITPACQSPMGFGGGHCEALLRPLALREALLNLPPPARA
jgi:hypothetical protein